LLKH
jgi:hypothetical protein